MEQYYIKTPDGKEGPFDAISMMRRIRAQKISRETLVYSEEETDAMPAEEMEGLKDFFSQLTPAGTFIKHSVSLMETLRAGWAFTQEHHDMTVYAGGLLLLTLLIGLLLVNMLGIVPGALASWVVYIFLNNLYLIFTLRLYRGQQVGREFLGKQLAPILLKLTVASCLMAMLMLGGAVIFILPGLVFTFFYIYTPFILLDQNVSLWKAMRGSRLLIYKMGRENFSTLCALILLYVISLALLIPTPLLLPIFASALCELYESVIPA